MHVQYSVVGVGRCGKGFGLNPPFGGLKADAPKHPTTRAAPLPFDQPCAECKILVQFFYALNNPANGEGVLKGY